MRSQIEKFYSRMRAMANETVEEKTELNDWTLYGEKEPHDLSKRLPRIPRNELKDLRS